IIIQLDGILIQYILFVVKNLAKFPYAFVPVAHPPFWAIVGFFAFAFGIVNILWSRIAKIFAVIGLGTVILFFAFFASQNGIYFLGTKNSAVYISQNGTNLLYFDGSLSTIQRYILPEIYSIGRRTVDNLCLPSSQNILKNGNEIIKILHPQYVFVPQDFPDTILQKYSSENLKSSNIFSIKFISPKNCLISVKSKKILVLEAPPRDSIPKDARLAFINFPHNFCDNDEWAKSIPKIVLGTNAQGWSNILHRKFFRTVRNKNLALKIGDI
ncbi:hypothetical protein J7L68_07060, partial [bacterium]|nr:hypothetical protein [bacterium]